MHRYWRWPLAASMCLSSIVLGGQEPSKPAVEKPRAEKAEKTSEPREAGKSAAGSEEKGASGKEGTKTDTKPAAAPSRPLGGTRPAIPLIRPGDLTKPKDSNTPTPDVKPKRLANGEKLTPSEEFAEIQNEIRQLQSEFSTAYTKAKTAEERREVLETKYPRPEKFAPRVLDLAVKYPSDPDAINWLIWAMRESRSMEATGKAAELLVARIEVDATHPSALEVLGTIVQTLRNGPARIRAVELLIERHVEDAGVGTQCLAISQRGAVMTSIEEFLSKVAERNPNSEDRGMAKFAIAKYLGNLVSLRRAIESNDEAKGQIELFYGAGTLTLLTNVDSDKVSERIESLLEQVSREATDVKYGRATLGEAAGRELFEIRHLAIGKTAPEIEGEDLDGVKFKLSDYRGKVVVLDFWGHW